MEFPLQRNVLKTNSNFPGCGTYVGISVSSSRNSSSVSGGSRRNRIEDHGRPNTNAEWSWKITVCGQLINITTVSEDLSLFLKSLFAMFFPILFMNFLE